MLKVKAIEEESSDLYDNFYLLTPSHTIPTFNPLPDDKILDQTEVKSFADDKLSVIKTIISVFERVENIMGKGEIACASNFSFSHNVFKRLLSQTRQKVSLCGNGLTTLKKALENTVGKGENAGNQHFLLFTVFSTLS